MDQRGGFNRNKNKLNGMIMKMKIKHIKNCGKQLKQYWGKFIALNAHIRKNGKDSNQ